MNIYSHLVNYLSDGWVVFEIALIIRDLLQGKGKTGKDHGTRYINLIAIFIAITRRGFSTTIHGSGSQAAERSRFT